MFFLKLGKKVEYYLTWVIEKLLIVMSITIFIFTFLLVLLRYIFNTSIFGAAEIISILFIYCSALGSVLLTRERAHINITVLLKKISIHWRKIIIILSYLIYASFNFYVFWLSLNWLASVGSFRSPILDLPDWVSRISIPLYSFLTIFYVIKNVFGLIYNNNNLETESTSNYDGS